MTTALQNHKHARHAHAERRGRAHARAAGGEVVSRLTDVFVLTVVLAAALVLTLRVLPGDLDPVRAARMFLTGIENQWAVR